MSLLVVGLSHRSAPVSVLERASLSADAKVKLLHDTLAAEPATEATVLATCNRIELYADVDKFHAGVAELSTLLAQHSGVALEELTPISTCTTRTGRCTTCSRWRAGWTRWSSARGRSSARSRTRWRWGRSSTPPGG